MITECDNTLTVTGPVDPVRAFMRTAQGQDSPLSLANFIPMHADLLVPVPGYSDRYLGEQDRDGAFPVLACTVDELVARYEQNLAAYGARHWLEWRRQHWGVEWDVSDAEWVHATLSGEGAATEASVDYWFTTVSAPPLPVYAAMSRQFPSLLIGGSYSWFFGPFYGHVSHRGGQLVEERYRPYPFNSGVVDNQRDCPVFVDELDPNGRNHPFEL